ncbi:MAG: hypothetical protein ACT4QB_20700 [Gammaproteobacteria bacterium]
MNEVLSMGRPWDLRRARPRGRPEALHERDGARGERLRHERRASRSQFRRAVQVFGKRKPGQTECAGWRPIVEGLCGEQPSA